MRPSDRLIPPKRVFVLLPRGGLTELLNSRGSTSARPTGSPRVLGRLFFWLPLTLNCKSGRRAHVHETDPNVQETEAMFLTRPLKALLFFSALECFVGARIVQNVATADIGGESVSVSSLTPNLHNSPPPAERSGASERRASESCSSASHALKNKSKIGLAAKRAFGVRCGRERDRHNFSRQILLVGAVADFSLFAL